ncbi:ArgE/DapE family deacylase [Clostridium estertheticum]|uniref:ArgE/DapE family deacylase n=1 Tax=Clostridium estertheticum TaxID=238834 RepID=UPI001CF41001|nr:ArgE/DapE family deacylase [Clostridium estertheticum]MCB2360075.1 ArgE/DapE family deacylase [Clostridium estertheticum]
MKEAIDFLKDLLKINSSNPPGNEIMVAMAIAKQLRESGIESTIQSVGDNRANLIARIKGTGHKKSLVFCGHMDTVSVGEIPWEHEPFGAEEIDGRIYGRGSSDMKGGLAALIMAMIEVSKSGITLEGDLVFAATAGEEVDCIGANTMVADGSLNGAGAMVIAEPSGGEIFVTHKGALWLEVISYGKTAHGSMPEHGINAIDNMNYFINALHDKFKFKYKEDSLLGDPTLNIATISGGVQVNVVPDMCKLQIDIRTVPGQNHQEILSDIKALLAEIELSSKAKFDIKVFNDKVALKNKSDDQFIKLTLDTATELFGSRYKAKGVTYCTDASIFVPSFSNNLSVIICGPGEETQAHKPNEYIKIKKYIDSIKLYKEIALRYLK